HSAPPSFFALLCLLLGPHSFPHDALPICEVSDGGAEFHFVLDDAARDPWADDAEVRQPLVAPARRAQAVAPARRAQAAVLLEQGDRKSTRLNSSHLGSSYAAFSLT